MTYILALGAAGAVFHPFRLSLAGAPAGYGGRFLIVGGSGGACLIDLQARALKFLKLGFEAHSFLPHPAGGLRFIGMEKWGPSAADLDFETGAVKPFNSGEHFHFYGHGLYSPAHKNIFITRVDHTTGLGHLVGYDPDTLEIRNDFQVTPGGLHECHWLPDGSMMVTSSGISPGGYANPQAGKRSEPSALKRVDMEGKGEVLGQLAIEDDDQILGHFTITGKGQILALSGPVPRGPPHGYLYYSPTPTEKLRRLEMGPELEAHLKSEMLSVALNGDQTRAAVTNPASGTIILVDMVEGKILTFAHQEARSVAFDRFDGKFLTGMGALTAIDENFARMEPFTLTTAAPQMPATGGAHSLAL